MPHLAQDLLWRFWHALGTETFLSLAMAALALGLALQARRAALGEGAPPPLAAAEAELSRAGRRLLRRLGFVLCLIGGLFATIAAEAAEVTASATPAGLVLGAALFGAAGLRCLWLASR